MKLTIQSGADHTEVVRYESDAIGFVAISGITRGAPAAVSAVTQLEVEISGVVHRVRECAITLSRETTR